MRHESGAVRAWASAACGLALVALGVTLNWPRDLPPPVPEPHRAESYGQGDAWFWRKREVGVTPAAVGRLDRVYQATRRVASTLTGIEGRRWVSLGPKPIAGTDAYRVAAGNPEYAGRVLALASHPTDARIMLAGSAMGGIWKSSNSGTSWTQTFGDVVYPAIGEVLFDPLDPRLAYAATQLRVTVRPSRLLRSTDGGDSWEEIPRPISGPGQFIRKVAVDHSNAGTLAASLFVLYSAPAALYRVDLGSGRYTPLLSGPSQFDDLISGHGGPNRLLVLARTAGAACGTACLAMYRSDDGGIRWTSASLTANAGNDLARMAVSRADPRLVAVALRDAALGRLRIFSSTDEGYTWRERPSPSAITPGGWPLTFAIDPNNAVRWFVGSVQLRGSTDGGESWAGLDAPHADQTAIAFDAENRLLLGSDGGVARWNGLPASWTDLNRGLDITQAYSIAVHPTSALTALTGTQDTGTLQFLGPSGWHQLTGGDGGMAAFDPADPYISFTSTQWSGTFFNFYRCDGRASTRSGCNVSRTTGIDKTDNYAFIPPFRVDPRNSQFIWLAGKRLYRSDNQAGSWAPVSPIGNFTALAISPADGNVVIAGGSSVLLVTEDRGNTWVDRRAGLPLQGPIEDIQFAPDSRDEVYVTLGGFDDRGKVFRSTNRGQSWSNISANLASIPVNSIFIEPATSPRRLYIGTDVGVFRTANSPAFSWEPFSDGLPPVVVTQLSYSATTNTLMASTYGRGIWAISTRLR